MKALSLMLCCIFLFSCSSDEESAQDINTIFIEANILNEEYKSESPVDFGQSGLLEYSCEFPNEDFIIFGQQFVPEIDAANLSLYATLYHYEEQNYFDNYNLENADIVADFDNQDCFNNFDFKIGLFIDGEGHLELDSNNAENYHQINKLEIYKENNREISYLVEGEFQGSYIGSSDNPITVTGKYRKIIYLFK